MLRKIVSEETAVIHARWSLVNGKFRQVKDGSDIICAHDVMLDQDCADCLFDARYEDTVEDEEVGA